MASAPLRCFCLAAISARARAISLSSPAMYSSSSAIPRSVRSLSFAGWRCGNRSSSSMRRSVCAVSSLPSAGPRHYIQGKSARERSSYRDFAMTAPLMPKATAVWLVENTSLTFDQIAEFCELHPLEVQAIADGDAAQGIKGLDPILTGQLTREEIQAAEADPKHQLHIAERKVRLPEAKPKKGPRYTPVSRRQDRPNAILWLVRNHPELKDSQIMRLVGTTKSTIQAIRDRTHWNAPNLQPMDPVTLGLCSQIDLDLEVHRAAKEKPAEVEAAGATLLPASETTIRPREVEPEEKPSEELSVESVFAKLKQIGGKGE